MSIYGAKLRSRLGWGGGGQELFAAGVLVGLHLKPYQFASTCLNLFLPTALQTPSQTAYDMPVFPKSLAILLKAVQFICLKK